MKTNVLKTICVTFGILIAARTASVSSQALASNLEASTPRADDTIHAQPQEPTKVDEEISFSEHSQTMSQICLTGDVLDAVKADREALTDRTSAVVAREKALAEVSTKLSAQAEQIESAGLALEARIALMKSVANEDIEHLVKMYQAMKPKQAAAIFDSMDPGFAAGFLRHMSGENAGLIMANMDARKSYSISVLMASKNSQYR